MTEDFRPSWFELSPTGFGAQSQARPLADLVQEGVQNALDQPGVTEVVVSLAPDALAIEDDGPGFASPELAFTLFMTDKAASAARRGRHGRGLKELLAVADLATIDTVGFCLRFDGQGRHLETNQRQRGTRLTLRRHTSPLELDLAVSRLRLLIPPEHVAVRLNGHELALPRRYCILRNCTLPTLAAEDGVLQQIVRETQVTLSWPRDPDEPTYLFELGLPVQPWPTPWHVDVGQRVPQGERRRQVDADFRLRLLTLVFDAVMPERATTDLKHHLQDPWVTEVVASGRCAEVALRAWAQALFGPRVLLPTDAQSDDRARQLGAHVLDRMSLQTLCEGQLTALGRVLETSSHFVTRRKQAEARVRAISPQEERAVAFVALLAKKILGRTVKVELWQKPADQDGMIESATFDANGFVLRINLLGKLDLAQPLAPQSLAILFHELAHAYSSEHGLAFIDGLERVAGQGAALLATDGRAMAELCGIPLTTD